MATSIREIDLERDARDIVALTREVNPTAVIDVASWLHRYRSVPDRAELACWVAESGGRVVGRVECFRNFFSVGSRSTHIGVAVRKSHRRRGLGRALFGRGLEHARALGAESLLGGFRENGAGTAFATVNGFELARAETVSVLDPASVRERPAADVELVPVREVDPHLVYAVDVGSTLDMPQTEQVDHMPYDEWLQHVLEHPLFTADGSFCAIDDGVVAAVSLLCVEPASARGLNMFTGTLRAHRGRGLALAVKLASTHWAAEQGVRQIVTTNDETNAPMLAINRRLGYRPAGRHVEYVRRSGV